MAHHEPVADRLDNVALARTVAYLLAAFFALIGILGFVPGATTGYDTMTFSGHESNALLFNVFQVSILHNVVHLAFGVAGAALARTVRGARGFLLGGGIVYLLLWIYGLMIDKAGSANFLPLNTADDWLHFGLGIGMIVLSLAMRTRLGRATPASTV
ncbi:DUF4383 domain-containing protein [Kibdelosporangium aridum]|uniref:DUF4383 domain-containing protein n=1 Tax=Kibdelosporangium aridum TaxID=2030 RepID=A0A428ZE78_KIBAR|nr:DUF4383 domain-containing protein [Kibdelosporangium aridum]RSM86403.1 DUF4383 domain-containing protein [Kibdelosporangium aridum]